MSELNPITNVAQLNDAFPILLFPLRLETRFKSTGNQQQLWLRVYPDDCNVSSNEDRLSEFELNNARDFWIGMWKAGGIEAEERGAWRSLVNNHGSGRSAWIINEYKPVNIINKPARINNEHKILVVASSLVLPAAENLAIKNYWADVWRAKGNTASITAAFNALAGATSQARANELVSQYAPVNLTDEPPAGIEKNKILLERIELPAYAANQSSWTKAVTTKGLPNKFVAIAYNGRNKKEILFSNAVKDQLPVSPDPSLEKDKQAKKQNGELVLNEDLQWMVDFEKAVSVGMATKIDLTAQEAAAGFDKLFVVGIRFTSAAQGGEQLESLLTDHFYGSNGFGLLKQGTPTNNTEDLPAGYSWTDDADESYERIFGQSKEAATEVELNRRSDGEKLADCLGIDGALLKWTPNASGRDQSEANAMNTALFPATLGYFMEEMMDPLFSNADIDATRYFFANYVSGRGPVPAIRVGRQPYGILPISVYSRLKFFKHGPVDISAVIGHPEIPYLARLHSLIMKMDAVWDGLLSNVAHLGKEGAEDAHQLLLDVVGLHAASVEFHQRYSQSIGQLFNQLVLQREPVLAADMARTHSQKATFVLEQLGMDFKGLKLPILDKYFLGEPNLLSGPVVDDVPDSETDPVRVYYEKGDIKLNYIAWLATARANDIRIENFEGAPAPTALLYLLLRHSLQLSQADAGTKLLVANNVVKSMKAFFDPDFIHVGKKATGKSKFEHLYSNYPEITGSRNARTKLIDHIYKPEVLQGAAEARALKETIDALKLLQNVPTARLERLLAEHLDCCHYRIDAWKTGLAQYKLMEQRNYQQQNGKPSKGIYLGAYGWLLDVKPEHKLLTDVKLDRELNEIFNKGNNSPLQTDSKNLGYIHAPSLNQAAAAAILRNAFDANSTAGPGNQFAIKLTSDRIRVACNFLEGIRNGQSLSALLGYQFERGLHDRYNLNADEVDKFIYPLRKAFPLVADNLRDTITTNTDINEAAEANNIADRSQVIQSLEARNVVDGLKLINHFQNAGTKTYPFDLPASPELPTATTAQARAIGEEVKRIADIHDAISDMVLSEQVYQVVQGNFERASGNADAFSKGSYPPEIAVVETPRSGITITHRVTIHFDAEAVAGAAMTPRAKAEPAVNKWLADNLPAPDKVLCRVIYSTPAMPGTEVAVSQTDLGLQPIDLLYILDLDTEQAMTELDDRIISYIHYNISRHPKTNIKINYTAEADPVDKTIVSFFELAALVSSLRKLIVGGPVLYPVKLTVPKDGQLQTALDEVKLKNRVTALKDALAPVKTAIETLLSSTKSVTSISRELTSRLELLIADASTIESIITALQDNLKAYLTDPSADNKNAMLNAFESSIVSVVDATAINNLRLFYDDSLDEYLADFQNFDKLVKDTTELNLNAAMYDNTQTGIGFMHQGISGVYDSVFSKLSVLIERWEKKQADFDIVMTGYNATGAAEAQFQLLQTAERIISAQPTFPLPADFNDYKINIIDSIKNDFDALLNSLIELAASPTQKLTDFINEVETVLANIGTHDVVPFDTELKKNSLDAEKRMLATLKEDVVTALVNLQHALAAKITGSTNLINDADATVINADKVSILLNAAKKILGEQALLLPQFSLAGTQSNEFESSYGSSEQLLDFTRAVENRILPVEDWLGGVARVREKIHSWENAAVLCNAFNAAAELDITPLQFPHQPGDRWLALKFRDPADPNEKDEAGKFKFKIETDKLLYSAHFAVAFDKAKPQCGIIIDEWTEVIPADEETTGIAFHYDQPNNEPPQTMLLVTPPEIKGHWSWENIIDAMEETLDMAKKRAIEPAQIENSMYGHFLPATIMAAAKHPITVAVDLAANNLSQQSI